MPFCVTDCKSNGANGAPHTDRFSWNSTPNVSAAKLRHNDLALSSFCPRSRFVGNWPVKLKLKGGWDELTQYLIVLCGPGELAKIEMGWSLAARMTARRIASKMIITHVVRTDTRGRDQVHNESWIHRSLTVSRRPRVCQERGRSYLMNQMRHREIHFELSTSVSEL